MLLIEEILVILYSFLTNILMKCKHLNNLISFKLCAKELIGITIFMFHCLIDLFLLKMMILMIKSVSLNVCIYRIPKAMISKYLIIYNLIKTVGFCFKH